MDGLLSFSGVGGYDDGVADEDSAASVVDGAVVVGSFFSSLHIVLCSSVMHRVLRSSMRRVLRFARAARWCRGASFKLHHPFWLIHSH